jgi:hypothetical protein
MTNFLATVMHSWGPGDAYTPELKGSGDYRGGGDRPRWAWGPAGRAPSIWWTEPAAAAGETVAERVEEAEEAAELGSKPPSR